MSSHSTVSRSRRLAGWLLLLFYVAAVPGFLPACLAAAAALHGDHSISITAAQGDWNMVLHHPDEADHDDHEHQAHGEYSAAEGDDDHHHGPDHVLHFSSAAHALTPAATSQPGQFFEALLPVILSAPACPARAVPDITGLVSARPPPGRPALLVCLRTIVLIV